MNQDMDQVVSKLSKINEKGIFNRNHYFNAAVLIPIISLDNKPHLLFQKRARAIRQGGEVSFPGGEHEKSDITYRRTAIRETVEEIGIPEDKINIIGRLDTYISRMGAIIEPFIGTLLIDDIGELHVDSSEVEKVFTVPLEYFMNNEPNTYKIKLHAHPSFIDERGKEVVLLPSKELGLPKLYHQPWGGKVHNIYVYHYNEEIIWGITADLIVDIVKKLKS